MGGVNGQTNPRSLALTVSLHEYSCAAVRMRGALADGRAPAKMPRRNFSRHGIDAARH